MKVVIIGGGIAGLTLGFFLNRKNIEVVVNEKSSGLSVRGHAFLMHTDALSILMGLSKESNVDLPGNILDTFTLRRPNGNEIKHIRLNSWKCIKRIDLIRFLYDVLPDDIIKTGRKFSHFIYEGDKVIAAAFTNKEIEYGDMFVGSDGGNSVVRDLVFGKVDFAPVKVKEIVGICTNEKIAKTHARIFSKFQNDVTGLAFGLIPTSENEFVWFVQYDPSISDIEDNSADALNAFCNKLLAGFPQVVKDILDSNDFSTTYVWNTRDFDLLPSFHKKNVVLIGDAAHLALPFTSAGTTNAIIDAQTLVQTLEEESDYEKAFEKFYRIRGEEVSKHIKLGRELTNLFLNPKSNSDDDLPVPLIPKKETIAHMHKNKPVQVLYFTDPICSTCWIIQPLLRKLELEYDEYLNIEYRMGGLLPSWDEYTKGKISKPSDAAKHWEEVCSCHEIPLDGDIWTEDPLVSSYPPSIAFKAAQMQDTDRAILFLRRIKEMVFVEKKNIIKWEYLRKAAFEVGLDAARLLRDFEGKAIESFKDDLRLAEQYNVKSFPTLFFSDGIQNQITIKGYQPYEKFEEIMQTLIPSVRKKEIDTNPESLFNHFPTMTNKEFAFLSNLSKDAAQKNLTELYEKEMIDKYQSKNGVIWISKFESVS